MKKILLLVSASLLANPICATIDWQNVKDVSILAGAVTISAIGTTIAGNYWHQAALEREKIAAAQADKHAKEENERKARKEAEQLKEKQAHASLTLHKIIHNYTLEMDALLHKDLSKNSKLFETIVKGKQSIPDTRHFDYGTNAVTNFETLIKLSPDLSPEEKKVQEAFISDLHQLICTFNTFFSEVAYAEKMQLKKNEYQDKMAQFALEKAEQENKTLRAKAEAYKAQSENTQLLKKIIHEIHIIKQDCSKIDTQAASVRTQMNHMYENLKSVIVASNTQIKQQLSDLFTKKMDDAAKKVQDALQNQAVPNVVVQQVQPPYNPAAVSQLVASEAIDGNAMPLPTPPPTYA